MFDTQYNFFPLSTVPCLSKCSRECVPGIVLEDPYC